MISPCIYTLTSPLHDESAVRAVSASFLKEIEDGLGCRFDIRGADFSSFGQSPLNIIFVRTGGTEGLFRSVSAEIGDRPVLLLASGKSNSLAASMEILSYVRQQGKSGEILHGSAGYIAGRISVLAAAAEAAAALRGRRFGVIGAPSDWLISSHADYASVRSLTGIEIVDVPMQELLDEIGRKEYPAEAASRLVQASGPHVGKSMEGALHIYGALKRIAGKYRLAGFTLRCFDLLGPVGNTGCLALAMLNSEGIVAGCEGDVPAMLTMAVAAALTGSSGFQANPSRIDVNTGEMVFAHCTIPLDMVRSYSYDTHFESGIGVAIRGQMDEGDITLFKLSGDLSRSYVCEGQLIRNLNEENLCRTQMQIRLDGDLRYFLESPIGNHHVIIKGHQAQLIRTFLNYIGL